MKAFTVLGISWAGIGTDHYPETLALFRDVLGLAVDAAAPEQAILRLPGNQQVEIFGRAGPGKTRNMPPTIAFEVDDFDAAVAALREAGIMLVGDAGEWHGHRWQYFATKDGHLFELKVSPRT